ncbi:hypothetical protein SLS58_003087 [Diplodia intermedia]|uniref:Beta-glucuronidase C-terminal domain-containing protein n=1 Tax=Diplodia intermedia TaxID=856260 RepID=A0ABR3TYG6_9PEZI
MKSINELAILCAAAATAAAAQNTSSSSDDASSTVHWSPPVAAGDATAVDKGYIGFGIEMKSFPDYANALSNFLFSQISARTGGAPIHIRVGGTSMDNAFYNESLTTTAVRATGDTSCALHTALDIGAPWLAAFRDLAPTLDTRYTVQIPLARKNVTNGVALAKACVDALLADGDALGDRLDGFEIGNEPNYYPTAGCGDETDRPSGWGPSDYADEWVAYAANLTAGVPALAKSGAKDWFQALTLASNVKNQTQWALSGIWDELDDGGYVKTISQHYYQAQATGTLQRDLLNHSGTVAEIRSKFAANMATAAAHDAPFVLGEVGAAIDAGAGEPNPALYGTLGGALWALDFALHGMALGISRASMQLGTNFRMSAWQPVANPGHPVAVHGNYYGLVAGAAFVGAGDEDGGNLQVRELDMDDHPNVVGYAGYNGGRLSKVAVLNLNVWNEGEAANNGTRPEKDISLTALGDDVASVRVSRLTAPGGAAANSSITWAGKRWTAENNGTEYADGEAPVTIGVEGGKPKRNVVVRASEAVLVELLRG